MISKCIIASHILHCDEKDTGVYVRKIMSYNNEWDYYENSDPSLYDVKAEMKKKKRLRRKRD